MKVAIVDAGERDNTGDAALLSVFIAQLKAAFGDVELAVAGGDDPNTHPEFEGARNLGSIRRWAGDESIPRARRISRKMVAAAIAVFWRRLPRGLSASLERLLPREVRGELSAIAEADLVAVPGGGSFSGSADLSGELNVFILLLPLLLAQRARVRTFVGPQSYGPFQSPFQRALARHVFGRADMVLAREDVSLDQLQAIGVSGRRVRRAVDSAFAFRGDVGGNWRSRLGVDEGETVVGLTARRWLSADAQRRFEGAMAAFVDSLASRPRWRVVLVPQVTCEYQGNDDRVVHERIAARCSSHPILLMDKLDHHDVKGLYAALDYVVGTRFHSIIFSLTSKVPCVAIEYEHKTRGIMGDLGLGEWVVPIEDVSAQRLAALFAELEANRDAYLAHLDRVLPSYRERADEVVYLLRAVCRDET